MSEIIPAILPKDPLDLRNKINELPKEIKWTHIDVLDTDVWESVDLNFEAHLMVENPAEIVEKWLERGAKRIIIHKQIEEITKFKDRAEIGLGVELNVGLEEVFSLIPQVDFLHLMSIAEIGEQGHPLDERIFDRIKKIKESFPEIILSVDGGVNVDNYQKLSDLGVERLIVGSGFKTLWKSLTKES